MHSTTSRKVERFREQPLRPGDPRLKPKGQLLIIGGHEDKEGDKEILRTLAESVGAGRLIVSTIASAEPDELWKTYEPIFRGLGVHHVYHLNAESRTDASSPRCMKILEGATAVFFTGGDQLKITSLIGDTPAFSRIFEIFLEGGMIAGTSAGASIMSETMIVRGSAEESHRVQGDLQLAPGLGLAKDMVIDQHFAERGRIGRLLGIVGQNPRIVGIGIDENTAILMRPQRDFRVLGEGGVTVLDGRNVTYSNIAEAEEGCTMSVFGVTLHLLGSGDVFDLRHRKPRDLPRAATGSVSSRAGRSRTNGNGRLNGTGRAKGNANGKSNGKSNGRKHAKSRTR